MKMISILGFTFLVSACSFSLDAEKINASAKTAQKQQTVRSVDVYAERNDIHLIRRHFV